MPKEKTFTEYQLTLFRMSPFGALGGCRFF